MPSHKLNQPAEETTDESDLHASIRVNLTPSAVCPVAIQPPPEMPGRLQESLANYLSRPTAKRVGASLPAAQRRVQKNMIAAMPVYEEAHRQLGMVCYSGDHVIVTSSPL